MAPYSLAVLDDRLADAFDDRALFSAGQRRRAINHAIAAGRHWHKDLQVDETIMIQDDVFDYALPTGCQHIYQVWMDQYNVDDSGTASAGAATTLTDSTKSWTTNDYANKRVVIVDGTGQGQYRTIISNTGSVLTISSGATDWDTNPDSTSEYKIVDITKTTQPPLRLRDLKPDTVGGYIRFPGQHITGHGLRIKYHKEYADLDASSDTTTMPSTYILWEAKSYLYGLLTSSSRQLTLNPQWNVQWWHQMAEDYKKQNPQKRPSGTVWTWSGVADGWATGPFRQARGY